MKKRIKTDLLEIYREIDRTIRINSIDKEKMGREKYHTNSNKQKARIKMRESV